MKTFILALTLLASHLSAMSLSEIIETSLRKSPSLESIQARIKANKQSIDIADSFANPQVALTTNSLDSSQKMSQTVLTFSQKIPYYSKREKQQNVAITDEGVLQEQLNDAKVTLVAMMKNEAYSIWELRALYGIIDEYIELTKQNIELYESYTTVSANQHMGIMKAKLSLSELNIQKSKLNAQIYSAKARLSYLASFDVKELDIALEMGEKPQLQKLQAKLITNPTLAIKTKELQKEEAKIALAEINNYPDINLVAGYAYRENFDNYFNFGLSLALPIYGTEDAKEEKARALALGVVSQREDIALNIITTLQTYYAQMLSAYEVYHIVHDDALPQVAHMFELSNSSISTGGDLFKYIDVLFDKLALEQKSITAVAAYYRASAQISKLSGELK